MRLGGTLTTFRARWGVASWRTLVLKSEFEVSDIQSFIIVQNRAIFDDVLSVRYDIVWTDDTCHQSTAFVARSVMDNSSSKDDTQTVGLAGCYGP